MRIENSWESMRVVPADAKLTPRQAAELAKREEVARRRRLAGRMLALIVATAACCLLLLLAGCDSTSGTTGPDAEDPPAAADETETSEIDASAQADAVTDAFAAITLADCALVPEDGIWSEADGLITTTGEVKGYIATTQNYADGEIRVQYRFPPNEDGELPSEEANTGLLFFINGEAKVWPSCIESQGKWSEMGQLKENGGFPDDEETFDAVRRDEARRPVGEWNELVVVIEPTMIKTLLNGVPVSTRPKQPGQSGAIGIQSERYPVEFRGFATSCEPVETAVATPEA